MKAYNGLIVLMAVGSLQGCAQAQIERNLDAKLAQETEVKTRSSLGQEAEERFNGMSGLSADQRAKLALLRETTARQLDQLTNQSLRLRSVLVKDLTDSKYNEDEIDLIKNRIRKIEEKKVSTIFDAADQANQILGRDAVKNKRVLDDFFLEPHGHYN